MGNITSCALSSWNSFADKKDQPYVLPHGPAYQDMKSPLSHYFISSGHNSYLTADQLLGDSGTKTIVQSLEGACRVIELDCYNGSLTDGPICKHGGTATKPILFKECVAVIKEFGFTASPYPVIITLENHTDHANQAVLVAILREVLAEQLYIPPATQAQDKWLSPEDLKGKFLIRAKTETVIQELAAITYIPITKFKGFAEMNAKTVVTSSSIGEAKVETLLKEAGRYVYSSPPTPSLAPFIHIRNRQSACQLVPEGEDPAAMDPEAENFAAMDPAAVYLAVGGRAAADLAAVDEAAAVDAAAVDPQQELPSAAPPCTTQSPPTRDACLSPSTPTSLACTGLAASSTAHPGIEAWQVLVDGRWKQGGKEQGVDRSVGAGMDRSLSKGVDASVDGGADLDEDVDGPGPSLLVNRMAGHMPDDSISTVLPTFISSLSHLPAASTAAKIGSINKFRMDVSRMGRAGMTAMSEMTKAKGVPAGSAVSKTTASSSGSSSGSRHCLQDALMYTRQHLLRVYPAAWRMDSSNYNPMVAWSMGASCVALNWQYWDKALWINQAKFKDNGGCGYVKKPDWMLDLSWGSPDMGLPPQKPRNLLLHLSSAFIPKDRWFPCKTPTRLLVVKMEVHGMPGDYSKKKTRSMANRGLWDIDESYQFPVAYPEMAVLLLVLGPSGIKGSETSNLGYISLPLGTLRPGSYKLALCGMDGVAPTNCWIKVDLSWDQPADAADAGQAPRQQ